jgi:hypothetical protein
MQLCPIDDSATRRPFARRDSQNQTVHKDTYFAVKFLEMTVGRGDNERHERSQITLGDHQIGCRINQMPP